MKFNNVMPFSIVPKKIKCLAINLTKYVQNLHDENHSMLMKETKEDLNNGRNFSCLRTGRLHSKDVMSLQIKLHV